MCTSPACPNGDTAFQYKHASQRRTMVFFQYSKLLWISPCSSFLLKNQTLFGFYSLSLAIASWIMPCVSCVDSDDDVYNFTSYYFPMNWLTVRKLVHFAYIYTLWFGKLKSFFPPKMARITLEPYVSKTSDWFSRGSSWIPKMNNRCWFFR